MFSLFHLQLSPKLMHTSRRDLIYIEVLLEVLPQISTGLGSGGCAIYFRTLILLCWNEFQVFWEVWSGWLGSWKISLACSTHGSQEFNLTNVGGLLSIYSPIYCSHMNSLLRGLAAPSHQWSTPNLRMPLICWPFGADPVFFNTGSLPSDPIQLVLL